MSWHGIFVVDVSDSYEAISIAVLPHLLIQEEHLSVNGESYVHYALVVCFS